VNGWSHCVLFSASLRRPFSRSFLSLLVLPFREPHTRTDTFYDSFFYQTPSPCTKIASPSIYALARSLARRQHVCAHRRVYSGDQLDCSFRSAGHHQQGPRAAVRVSSRSIQHSGFSTSALPRITLRPTGWSSAFTEHPPRKNHHSGPGGCPSSSWPYATPSSRIPARHPLNLFTGRLSAFLVSYSTPRPRGKFSRFRHDTQVVYGRASTDARVQPRSDPSYLRAHAARFRQPYFRPHRRAARSASTALRGTLRRAKPMSEGFQAAAVFLFQRMLAAT